ncbi:MAG: Na/Pi cotransporter family protein [Clostridia bacterium]|nr:Na/Pi cotransporter family protein [Clostridia bacterium]
MTFANWTGIAGGLALFLYGIRVMGDGLRNLAGAKLKVVLEKLTRNRFLGALIGFLVTAVIQSSNATTSMTVGFVDAGLMAFTRASGVIIGANVGTTVTGLLIALKIDPIAPIVAFVGVSAIVFFKNKNVNNFGGVIAGFGILFIGMTLMKGNMAPLANEPAFTNMLMSFEHKFLLAILVGALFTAVVQSVSASVGILQAMATAGAITGIGQVVYLILGMNIGSCVTAVVTSIGGTKDAKRTAAIHVLFNVFAAILFVITWKLLPMESWISALSPHMKTQIAYFNFFEKLAAAILIFPFLPLIEKLARVIIPGEDKNKSKALVHIKSSDFATLSVAIAQAQNEVARMYDLSHRNLALACKLLTQEKAPSHGDMSAIEKNEETIDYLNHAITDALIKITAAGPGLAPSDARVVDRMHHVICDYERIGDHADNIAGYVRHIREQGLDFSGGAREDLIELTQKVLDFVVSAQAFFDGKTEFTIDDIERMEESVDGDVDRIQEQHIRRMEKGNCTPEIGMLFVEILTDLERVADHALNVAQAATR